MKFVVLTLILVQKKQQKNGHLRSSSLVSPSPCLWLIFMVTCHSRNSRPRFLPQLWTFPRIAETFDFSANKILIDGLVDYKYLRFLGIFVMIYDLSLNVTLQIETTLLKKHNDYIFTRVFKSYHVNPKILIFLQVHYWEHTFIIYHS